jgi:hypothetical protein
MCLCVFSIFLPDVTSHLTLPHLTTVLFSPPSPPADLTVYSETAEGLKKILEDYLEIDASISDSLLNSGVLLQYFKMLPYSASELVFDLNEVCISECLFMLCAYA